MKHVWKRSACLLLALALCVPLLAAFGTPASAATMEERQHAVVAAAMAYYDKGQSVQYDGTTLVSGINRSDGGKTRSTNCAAPEYATPNETLYSVCSDFAHQVYYEAFRYHLTGSAGNCWTGTIIEIPKDDPISVWTYEKSDTNDVNEEVTKMFALIQPGDVYTTVSKSGAGHTMVYVGDVLGDGKTYLAHCYGAHMDTAEKRDTREYPVGAETDPRCGAKSYADAKGGAIRLSEAEKFVRNSYCKGSQVRMNLVRPLNNMPEDKYPMRDATKYRVSHPRLAIDRTLNKTRFNSAFPGETVTMTLKLSNSSENAYTVPVTEKVPAGAAVKKPFEGATVSGDTMTWNVELKAGEEKTFTAEYEITAKRGETVTFEGGSVGDIPSNVIPIRVGGKKLNADDLKKLDAVAKGEYDAQLKDSGANAATLGDFVWQKVLGLNVQIPENKVITKSLTEDAKTPSGIKTRVFKKADSVAAADLTSYQMLVPTCWGGFDMWLPFGSDRCADPRDKHLEPGDIVVRSTASRIASQGNQLVYLGNGKYLSFNASKKTYSIVEEPEFFKSLLYKLFYVLRPTLAYDDVHDLPAITAPAKEFKFTDVKEGDWFYTYVKDLVEDGTVNGMTETTFVPQGTLTYGQALKLIALAVGEKEPAKSGTHWASGYLTLAKSKGWLASDVDLNGTITRLALCRIAAKAKKLTEAPEKNPFTDTVDADVLALYKAGVINGMTATEFRPNGLLTRAQISKIIWTLRKV